MICVESLNKRLYPLLNPGNIPTMTEKVLTGMLIINSNKQTIFWGSNVAQT